MRKWMLWFTLPLLYSAPKAWADSGVITPGRVGSIEMGRAPNLGAVSSPRVNVPFDASKHRIVGMPQTQPSMLERLAAMLPDLPFLKKSAKPYAPMPGTQLRPN